MARPARIREHSDVADSVGGELCLREPRVRSRVEARDVPAVKAARRLHLPLDVFLQKLPELLRRGFPPADVTTGMFDLDAIDAWRRSAIRSYTA